MFTYDQPRLFVSTYVYHSLPLLVIYVHPWLSMFTRVYLCSHMFTHFYRCLLVFTYVYKCLLVFTYFYHCFAPAC